MTIKYSYNGELLSHYQLRQAFPNVSFPKEPTQESLEELGVTIVDVPAPEPTLEDLKNRKLAELEGAFDQRVRGSFICSLGYPMQFNRTDCVAVRGALDLMERNHLEYGYLTDADDVTHYDVMAANIEAVYTEMLAAYAQCHGGKQQLRTAINAAATAEELDAIEFVWSIDLQEE